MNIEICVDSYEQTLVAQKYGAQRVELCSALEIGGLTPSLGLVKKCTSLSKIEIHPIIRPGAGGFTYNLEEMEIMEHDIRSFAEEGIAGVVFGVLTKRMDLDIECNQRLLALSKSMGLEVTFHRAFDFIKDPFKALDQLIELKFDRILTSGQKPKAIEGIDMIKKLVDHANRRIQIMAGSDISAENAGLLQKTGIDAIHFTARKVKNELQKKGMDMGDEFEPDPSKIMSVLKALN